MNIADQLAGGALLIASITMIYTIWYAELQAAINADYDRFIAAHNADVRTQVQSALRYRSLPLTAAASLIFLIFAPGTIEIAADSVRFFLASGYRYDASKACLAFADLFSLILAIHLFGLSNQIAKRYREICAVPVAGNKGK